MLVAIGKSAVLSNPISRRWRRQSCGITPPTVVYICDPLKASIITLCNAYDQYEPRPAVGCKITEMKIVAFRESTSNRRKSHLFGSTHAVRSGGGAKRFFPFDVGLHNDGENRSHDSGDISADK